MSHSHISLEELREKYKAAIQNAEDAEDFWEELKDYQGLRAVHLAYKATARALLAKHSWNPYHKWTFLKESMKFFKKAVILDPQNIEIRFLRFAIQHYIPAFLDQSDELIEDKEVMLANFHRFHEFQLEKKEAETFFQFYKESERFNQIELERLAQYLT